MVCKNKVYIEEQAEKLSAEELEKDSRIGCLNCNLDYCVDRIDINDEKGIEEIVKGFQL